MTQPPPRKTLPELLSTLYINSTEVLRNGHLVTFSNFCSVLFAFSIEVYLFILYKSEGTKSSLICSIPDAPEHDVLLEVSG